MRQFKATLVALVIVWSLAAGTLSAQSKAKPTLQVDTFESPAEQLAWLSYGVGLATFVSDHQLTQALPAGTWKPSFDAEVFARQFQLKVWDEATGKQQLSYDFMDQMELVAKADFLEEYVWRYYKHPDWPTPEGLRISEFENWIPSNLQNHRPMTGASVTIER
ncbi:hypothetical protein E4582_01940 [Luteimonas yindakuii]|uniref:Uncharacterized protein n=1 Tax=Luteimonas yindakuii TaxID=2565782 RepID=A0A4Z1R1Y4_9GAMM|nr:hypothetical protein [Luteimonas yindakuii]TKS53654.1 hypothetical protein E4582_01940 [Luteimonas yindakuii]